MVSSEVEESLLTSGDLKWTFAPHFLDSQAMSSWSVDTQTESNSFESTAARKTQAEVDDE